MSTLRYRLFCAVKEGKRREELLAMGVRPVIRDALRQMCVLGVLRRNRDVYTVADGTRITATNCGCFKSSGKAKPKPSQHKPAERWQFEPTELDKCWPPGPRI